MHTIFIIASIFAAIAVAGALAYHRANALAWSIAMAAGVAALTWLTGTPLAVLTVLWVAVGIFAVFGIVKPLRRATVSRLFFGIYKKVLPQVSQTEQEALDAGSIWWDADLFTGKPDWEKLLAYPEARLSAEDRVRYARERFSRTSRKRRPATPPPRTWFAVRIAGHSGLFRSGPRTAT